MRYGSYSVWSAALIGLAWFAGPATAQSRPGWVDPPARTEPKGEAKGDAKADIGAPAAGSARPDTSVEVEPSTPAAARRAAHPSRQRTSVREGRRRDAGTNGRAIRPLSRTPALAAPATPMASADRFPEWAAAASRLSDDYLDSVSAPGLGMVTAAPRFYAERVRFHGRMLSLAALMDEKRRFVARWPERRYDPQSGATRTACNAATATCIVQTTFDYRAENPGKGARAQGVSELVLTLDMSGGRPVIVSETSRVLRRYGPGPLGAIAGPRRGA
ncbi:hypothetical protein [Methylobacterium sp. J-090]|uniref:hypothetical protein n=1 Tax=Methylobacterium sp. J-090 TaxID=2836666 RepID=UPI001FBA8AEF|nr:hypothetical protein [Methylobacterium sp. J-090]MCJ2084348.1 hypothetical protein [Methylobacterium sp. J-090]